MTLAYVIELTASAAVGTNIPAATAIEWRFLCDCLRGQAAGDRRQISTRIHGSTQSTIDVNGQTT